MATRLNPSNFGYQNFYSSTLTGDITAGTLTIGLATVPTPTSGILIIEPDSTSNREVIVYTSKGASTITCPSDGRGYSGTTPAAHLTGSTVIMAPVDKWFTALASGELSTDPLRTELYFDYVASGLIWSGDSYASTRNASMTSGVVYVNGRRLTASAVTSRSFTASKDTYIDASDNGDGTALLTYTEVANNATSPALAANSIRIGIIVTGASNIASVGSINQGQSSKILPLVSSTYLQVTDSLGNPICNRDPLWKTLVVRSMGTSSPTASTTGAQVTNGTINLSGTVNFPSSMIGRRVKVSGMTRNTQINTGGAYIVMGLWAGTVGSGTLIAEHQSYAPAATQGQPSAPFGFYDVTASGAVTFNVSMRTSNAANTVYLEVSAAICVEMA